MSPRSRIQVLEMENLQNFPKEEFFLRLMHEKRVEKVPIVDSKNRILGLVTLKDVMRMKERPNCNLDDKG